MTTSAEETHRAFDDGVEPRSMWLGEPFGGALAVLRTAVQEDEGIVVLTGEVGTGKTLLTKTLLLRLRQDTIVGTVLFPRVERLDLLRAVAHAYGLPSEFDSPDAFYPEFEAFLRRTGAAGKRVLFVIDEAQALPQASLSEIGRLLRPGRAPSDGRAAFNVLLVGQDELRTALGEPRNASLARRVTAQCRLRPLTEDEVPAYLAHRLADTGAQRPAFTTSEAREIHRGSGGLPRVINQLARQTVPAAPRIVTKPGEVALRGDRPRPSRATRATKVPRAASVARPADTSGPRETAPASETAPADVEPVEVEATSAPAAAEEPESLRHGREGAAMSRRRRRAVMVGAALVAVALGIAGYRAVRGRDTSVDSPSGREAGSDTASSTAPAAAPTDETTSGSVGEGRSAQEPVMPPASQADAPAEPVTPPATPELAKPETQAEPTPLPAAAQAPRAPATPEAGKSEPVAEAPKLPAAQAPAARPPAASDAAKAPDTREATPSSETRQGSPRRRTAETPAPSRPTVTPPVKPSKDVQPAPRVEERAPARPTAPAPRRPTNEAQDAPDPGAIIDWLLKERAPGG